MAAEIGSPDAFASTWTVSKPALRGPGGIVCAQNRKAAAAGAAILEAGGNAVDAAVATSFALGAAEPWMSGLGGGGCMLIWPADAERPTAIDCGMVAPLALDPGDYPLAGGLAADLFGWPAVVEDRNLRGPLAVCTPTLLAGIGLAHDRFGSMPWGGLVAPAVELARQGLEVDWYAALVIGQSAAELTADPTARQIWLPGGRPPALAYSGELSDLALGRLPETLATVAAEGPMALRKGEVGQALVADLAAAGGRLNLADLDGYVARAVEPLAASYRQSRLFAMPGLFAGNTFVRCLELLAAEALAAGFAAAAYLAYAAALETAYRERLEREGGGEPASCTSHFVVVDRHGSMIAVTQTLLSLFGSKVVSPATGLLLNNGVMWFDPRPGRPNSMGPGKRPLSNMCPVMGELPPGPGRPAGARFALGASGGRRILPAVLQLASFLIDGGCDLDTAFAAPRLDCSGTGTVLLNPALDGAICDAVAMCHSTRLRRPAVYPALYACPSGVLHDLDSKINEAAAEPMQPWAGPVAERPRPG